MLRLARAKGADPSSVGMLVLRTAECADIEAEMNEHALKIQTAVTAKAFEQVTAIRRHPNACAYTAL